MGSVVGYKCDRCPIAFEVGDYAYWSLTGKCVKAVCGRCGTMHRLESERGVSRVLALPGPIRSLPLVTRPSGWGDGTQVTDYEWPFAKTDWQVVAELPADAELGSVACGRCGVLGCLVCQEEINAGGERCPVCGEQLFGAYFDTVN
jgi:hypothetical protein